MMKLPHRLGLSGFYPVDANIPDSFARAFLLQGQSDESWPFVDLEDSIPVNPSRFVEFDIVVEDYLPRSVKELEVAQIRKEIRLHNRKLHRSRPKTRLHGLLSLQDMVFIGRFVHVSDDLGELAIVALVGDLGAGSTVDARTEEFLFEVEKSTGHVVISWF